MTRKELVCVLRDYAKMTEEPPTGRAIEGQEEIMRRAADMIENSVEIDRVLEIIELNKFCKHNDNEQAKEWNKWSDDLTSDIKALKGERE